MSKVLCVTLNTIPILLKPLVAFPNDNTKAKHCTVASPFGVKIHQSQQSYIKVNCQQTVEFVTETARAL